MAVQDKDKLVSLEDLKTAYDDLDGGLDEKLNVNQGAGNAGKAMVVGPDGNLTPEDITIEVDPTLTQEGEAADAKAVGDALAKKADQNGAYENLTAGNAMQLDSSVYAEDQVPYLFRQTGGGVNAGTREIDTIVGGTVAWNQKNNLTTGSYSENGITFAYNNGKITITGTATATATHYPYSRILRALSDHAVLVLFKSQDGVRFQNVGSSSNIIKPSSTAAYGFYIESGTSNLNYESYVLISDLTQMFGTAIADRAYALEQATAGSGIAWLKSMGFFTQDYYPYDAGTLKSVEGLQSHTMRGFNQWDEEWEEGGLDNSGGTSADTNRIRSKNFISVIPGETYYLYCATPTNYASNFQFGVYYYDAINEFVSQGIISNNSITIPNDVHYMKFITGGTGRVSHPVYKNDICINLSDPAKNGTYEPYQKHSYPLDSDLTLRGIPKLDANNKLYYDGDTYEADGSVTRKYGIVDLGTMTWGYQSEVGRFTATAPAGIQLPPSNNVAANLICSSYETTPSSSTGSSSYNRVIGLTTGRTLCIRDSAYTDAATFEAAMSGVYLVYELATPTAETADPFQTPQICDKSGTEEYVTTGIVSVGHNTKYPVDQVKKLDNLPSDLSFVGPIENGATCQNANGYLQWQYFVKNNQFCKAKTAIASGATFTLNTNYEVTSIAAELYAALNS